jgi:hypothetical protein
MMNFLSPFRRQVSYQSLLWLESESLPGVEFCIRKVSLASRIEMSSRIRELTLRNEFLKAGALDDQLEARLADLLVRKLYVEWAIAGVRGLEIDGAIATVPLVIDKGPEYLVAEMADAIQQHIQLSETERKNS